jgi:hypothetical protein
MCRLWPNLKYYSKMSLDGFMRSNSKSKYGASGLRHKSGRYRTRNRITDHRPRDDLRGVWACPARCGEASVYRGDYCTAIVRSHRLFHFYTQTENIEHFEYRVASENTVPVFSGWVAAARHSPQIVARAYLSRS